MEIRPADKQTDFDKIWEIFENVISTGDTYVFDPNTPKSSLDKHWFAEYMNTFVAIDNGEILGTYIIKPNQIDLGNHIANCSYMVNPKHHGRGTGKLLCEHSIQFAKDNGYLGIQFNIVVSTNEGAVKLWEKFGFDIIGKTPKAFRHKTLGFVDAFIMYKDLTDAAITK
ncbi:GNAT family N-acetyltransferase [Pedobacter ginsengiterrae]|uniref:GNAT family N-acetyltransferase n=1 Tax=Pedobacter ginsengiterrae TaxID=871696 RepID=A0ABP7PAI2_9SPHI|nr:GNAT family N-acetyltransferase [Pedobacter aquatilis]